MRWVVLVAAAQVSFRSVAALPTHLQIDFPTTTSSSVVTSTSISSIPISFSITSTSTSVSSTPSAKSTPLFLPVSASAPDPLGIAQVSGFYGPGAWAAWFLTVVASWLRIIQKSEEKFDVNTVLFLLGTNWAAVDVFRSIHALRSFDSSQTNYSADFTSGMGSYGAAFIVLFWGSFHALMQIPSTIEGFSTLSCRSRRVWTLVLGLVLPLIALTATLFGPIFTGLGGHAINFFPALYWKGMGDTTHGLLVGLAAGTTLFVVAPGFFFSIIEQKEKLPAGLLRLYENTVRYLGWIIDLTLGFYALFSFVMMVVSVVVCIATDNDKWLWGMAPFFMLFSMIVVITAMMSWLFYIPGGILVYLVKGYLHIGSNVSESCFFMPCSPQSIRDEDQMYSLLAGLAAFIAFEVLPPVWKDLRRRYREDRMFVQNGMRQFEMRRWTQAVLNP